MTGISIDAELGPAILGLTAQLAATKISLDRLVAAQTAVEERYQREGPVFVPIGRSATTDATGARLLMDLGGPSYGRAWEVRQLVVGGLTWSTTVSGRAELYVGSTPQVNAALANLQDVAATLPSKSFYSAGQFRVIHPNRVYVVIAGGSDNTTYVVSGDALETPDLPVRSYYEV